MISIIIKKTESHILYNKVNLNYNIFHFELSQSLILSISNLNNDNLLIKYIEIF